MNKTMSIRVDNETIEILEELKQKLKIGKSDIIRMSISMFKNYVEKVNN